MFVIRRLAMAVGLAGLIPFVAGALSIWLITGHQPMIERLFYLYCAGILAFMAGIYWPISLQLNNCTYPISPPMALALSQGFFLVGGMVFLLPSLSRAMIYPLAYVLLYLVDLKLMPGYWPRWYLRMRGLLTLVAVLAQLVVLAALL